MDSLEFTRESVFNKRTKSGKQQRHWKDSSCLEVERLQEPEIDLDEEDEFERDMLKVFEERLHKAEVDGGIRSSSDVLNKPDSKSKTKAKNNQQTNSNENELYDKIYFDSDDDSEEDLKMECSSSAANKSSSGNEKRKVLSNDELMYDPEMDDEDQAWADNIRKGYQNVHPHSR